MTDSPQPIDPNNPYGQPLPYAMSSYAAQGSIPGSITVMSILAIVFGSLGLLCGGFGLISQLIMLSMGGRNPFMPQLPVTSMAVTAYGAFAILLSVILSAALLAGGIGGIKLRPWARPAMIWWSVVTIAWATLTLVITLLWINPAAAKLFQQVQLQTNPRGAAAVAPILGPIQTISALVRWLLTCVLPVCFLILWRSPKVIEAFAAPDVQAFQR